MKYESFLLRAMFVVCMVLCFATLGAMFFPPQPETVTSVNAAQLSGHHGHESASAIVPLACPLIPDGVLCPRKD